MPFNKYSKTPQFDAAIKSIRMNCNYHNLPYPTITFRGTVKLHGTNAAVGYRVVQDKVEHVWFQSRERVISVESDNAGFAAWASKHTDSFRGMCANFARAFDTDEIMIYGEWAGGSIQGSDVAIRHLPKTFYVFAIKAKAGTRTQKDENGVEQEVKVWNDVYINNVTFSGIPGMRNINEFMTFIVDVDVANPSASLRVLQDLTMDVEAVCPVSMAQGYSGTGEGIVWVAQGIVDGNDDAIIFKTKGDKHSTSKVTTLRVPTAEELARIAAAGDFVDAVATTNRLDQGFDKLRELGLTVEMKNLGTYLKWVATDIQEEDGEMIEAAMVDRKALGSAVTKKAKEYFINKMKEI